MQNSSESAIGNAQMQLQLMEGDPGSCLSDLLTSAGLHELFGTSRHGDDENIKERQQQKAEDTLRKLWRTVEQSADLVMITDREGVIEYVNPAF